ncbi:hypothetical protein [Burkholderia sp. A1]|uniref:terpene synthase family protein n=1 Tax=Burkholderia sp. A1 TaxID=148446 RepID=UPI000AFB7DB7|nr:hypothetical protein [Burkholderia sp. A1]
MFRRRIVVGLPASLAGSAHEPDVSESMLSSPRILIYCPLPSRMHPRVAAMGRRSLQWLSRLGLLAGPEAAERVLQSGAAEWAARIAPDSDEIRLQIVSDWMHLSCLLDDRRFDPDVLGGTDGSGRLVPWMMRLLEPLDHPEAAVEGDAFVMAFRDLSVRVRAGAPARIVRRWVEGNMEWFFAAACLSAQRAATAAPSLVEYMNLGPRGRAMKLVGALIEIAEETYLPDLDREEPKVRALNQVANVLVTMANDLFSFDAMAERRSLDSNIVNVVRHERGLDLPAAFDAAADLHNRLMYLYLALRASVEHGASRLLLRHLRQLDHMIAGNLEWTREMSRRCASPWRPISILDRTPYPADADARVGRPAPDISSIAWWWDQVSSGKLVWR